MAALLLAGWDGEARSPQQGRSKVCRHRKKLAPSHFLEQRLHGAPSFPKRSFCLLVKVEPGRAYDGPLTWWNAEEKILWDFVGRPHDAFSMTITALAALDSPVSASGHTDVYGTVSSQVQSFPEFDATRVSGMTRDGRHATGHGLQQLLGLSAAAWNNVVENGPFLWVPMKILQAIGHGRWSSLLLRYALAMGKEASTSRLPTAFSNCAWPPREWIHRLEILRQGQLADVSQLSFSSHHADELAQNLRRWHGKILDGLTGDDYLAERLVLEEEVLRLDAFAGVHSAGDTDDLVKARQDLKAMFAAARLKNRGKLKETMCISVALMSRPSLAQQLKEDVAKVPILVEQAVCCFCVLTRQAGL